MGGVIAKVQRIIFCITAVIITGFTSIFLHPDSLSGSAFMSNNDAAAAAELALPDFSTPSSLLRANEAGPMEKMHFALDERQTSRVNFDAASSLHLIYTGPISTVNAGDVEVTATVDTGVASSAAADVYSFGSGATVSTLPCTIDSGNISCNVSLQMDGYYRVTINANDGAGNLGTTVGIVAVNVPSSIFLPISIKVAGVYWASYADYRARTLSVGVDIHNQGSNTAYDAAITKASNTNGVTLISSIPLEIGDLAAGDKRSETMKYYVPPGVSSFRSILTGSANDAVGIQHEFINGPMDYGIPRVIARFTGTLDCDFPVGLSFDTEGPAEDRPVTQDGVSLFGYFHEPEADITNPRALPYVFLREDDANGFDHTQAWWMAMEIELGYGYDDVSPCITFDWFNITTPNETRTGTINNEGFILDYYSKTGVLSSKKIGFWRIPNDLRGHATIVMPDNFSAGDVYRLVVSWSQETGLAFYLTPVSAKLPMISAYDSSSLAKIPTFAENPYITISGSIAWDGMEPSWRSYQDNSKHRYFILANGEISDAAISEYMANPPNFIAGILSM